MGLESGTFISDLNPANPASNDPKAQGDDHLRLIKSTLKATFPNVTGAVTATHSALSTVGITQPNSVNDTSVASTAYVNNAILAATLAPGVLPAQSGNAGKVLQTNGSTPSWQSLAVSRADTVLSISDLGALTFPASVVTGANARVMRLSATLDVAIFANVSTSGAIQLVAYNPATGSVGSPVLVRNTAFLLGAAALSSTSILLVSCNATTGLEAVVVSFSGVTATVNTAATATLAGNISVSTTLNTVARLGTSSTFAIFYNRATNILGVRAISVTGTTPTIGAETTVTGTSSGSGGIVSLSDTSFLTVHAASSTTYATPFTVSGTTLTKGTEASTSGSTAIVFGLSSSGAVLTNVGSVTVASNVATISAASYSINSYKIIGNYFVGSSGVLYDNAGAITSIALPVGISLMGFVGNTPYALRAGRFGYLSFSGSTINFNDIGPANTQIPTFGGSVVTATTEWQDGAICYASAYPVEGATTSVCTNLRANEAVASFISSNGANGTTLPVVDGSLKRTDPSISLNIDISGTGVRFVTIKALA